MIDVDKPIKSIKWVHASTYDRNGVLIWDRNRGDIDPPGVACVDDLPGGRCIRVSNLDDVADEGENCG